MGIGRLDSLMGIDYTLVSRKETVSHLYSYTKPSKFHQYRLEYCTSKIGVLSSACPYLVPYINFSMTFLAVCYPWYEEK